MEVAEEVMGWKCSYDRVSLHGDFAHVYHGPGANQRKRRHWFPSISIADAWKLVEQFGLFTLEDGGKHQPEGERWWASFPTEDAEGEPHWVGAHGATAPLAICKAALAARRTP